MASDIHERQPQPPSVDRAHGSAGLWRMFLLSLTLIGAVAAIAFYQRDNASSPAVLAALGILAMLGVLFLFFLVMGYIQLTSRRNARWFSRDLVDGMASGLIATDGEGRVVYANRAYADLTGSATPDDVESVEAVFSRRPEASEVVYHMANRARRGESAVEEFRLAGGLGASVEGARWFRLSARAMETPGHAEALTVWQVSDVTEDRHKHEAAFQELQNAIHYLDHAPAGFLSSEPGGALVYMNATLADWLGIDLVRFKPGSINLRDLVVGDGMALLDSIEAGAEDIRTAIVDLDLLKSDGKSLPVRLYHKVPPTVDGAPGATRTVVINRNVSGDSEQELQASEVRFTRFFNNTPMGIAALNHKGVIVRANAPFQRLFASVVSKRGKATGIKLTKIGAGEDRQVLKQLVATALAGEANIDPVDITLADADGGEDRSVRLYASAAGDLADDDAQERVIVYAMETTEQRALEQQFAQSQKMQAVGQLAGGVAHDFNNVLTAIIGFSDLLLANHRPSDPSFQDIMNIKQNANRAASLVRQLLAFSRRQTLRPQVLQLADALSDLRMLLDRLLGEKVDLSVVHGRDLWPVKVDISQFEQVIVNLAVNARDAMPDGGKLTIATRSVDAGEVGKKYKYPQMPAADYVLIEVIDEGVGMSAQVLEKIFEPFFSTKDVGRGTGLGLSTVYGIVKQTGGYIFADSKPGEGTTFRVFLPRHIPDEKEVAEEEEAKQEDTKRPVQDLTGSAKILLVEDEDAVRAFGTRALTSRGYEVHEAANGAEALELLKELDGVVDLVVSDVVMPEMDGPTLLKELRKDHPDLKFVFVSGYAEDAFAKNLPDGEQGKFGFLPKPYSLKQLATTVKEMLD